MTCGTGLCMGCVLPAVGNDGITRMVRACVDGPVFRGDLVRWDDVGTIPFDALGAPGWKPARGHPGHPDGGAVQCRLTCGPGSVTWTCRARSSPPRGARAPGGSWPSSPTWPGSAR